MKRILASLVISALAAGSFAKDTNSDFRSFIIRILPKVSNAFDTKNPDFFKTIATPDFTETEGGKTMSGKQSMAMMKQQFAMIDKVSCHFQLLSCSVKGNIGTAMTTGVASMTFKKQRPTDTAHVMVIHMWEKETWVRSGNTWKIHNLEESKPAQMTMDGKPTHGM